VKREKIGPSVVFPVGDALDVFGGSRDHVMGRVYHFLRLWMPDQEDLAARLRVYEGTPALDFELAADELQMMAREEMRPHLVSEGMSEDYAEHAAKIFTFSTLLDESDADEYRPPA
jgi:hypothetical protein